MKSRLIILSFLFLTLLSFGQKKNYEVLSPDKKVKIQVTCGKDISYMVFYQADTLLNNSEISLSLENAVLGIKPVVTSRKLKVIDEKINNVLGKRKTINDNCNEMEISFKGNYSLFFRAYNDGVAYRWSTNKKDSLIVKDEKIEYNFTDDLNTYVAYGNKEMHQANENNFILQKISKTKTDSLIFLPSIVQLKNGMSLGISEADLLDYPGMFLTLNTKKVNSLKAVLPQFPLEEKVDNLERRVTKTADYLAKTNGIRSFPWRMIYIAKTDADLPNCDLPYRLATPCKLKDVSWIKPGKVAWDWWHSCILTGVPFKSGINTETYKYYIDFAANNKLEYVNIDEGWSDELDLYKTNPDIDIKYLAEYAQKKNIGLFLWCDWHTLDAQMPAIMDKFHALGIAGLKIDFMDRDDQIAVNFYERVANESAKRHFLVNFHGAYKPTGLERTYPNTLNREGVFGNENSKWTNRCDPEHTVTIPFTRMLAGHMDFTPGALTNVNKENFHPNWSLPMAQGTRCNQFAMFIIYDAPLQMLCDAPSKYEKEKDMMDFVSKVSTVWDETKILDGKIGDFIITARQTGDEWYVGGMTDWTARTLKLDFAFLGEGSYTADIYADGENADKNAIDYTRKKQEVDKNTKLDMKLASGGGFFMRITKK